MTTRGTLQPRPFDATTFGLMVNTIKGLSMDAVQAANSGHPGMPMGMAHAAATLWTRYLVHDPKRPDWIDRDRFVLSAGHGSMLLYSLLHLSGYDLGLEELKNFRQLDSRTPGHPEYGETPRPSRSPPAPLGSGFAAGVGLALAERILGERYNRSGHEVVDHYTYGIVSDGDLMEGIASEAASLAGHLGLGKLVYLYDDNGISIDGSTDLSFTEDVAKRFESYGWHVQKVDGHDSEAISSAIAAARGERQKPSIICCKTVIGHGSPNLAGSEKTHGATARPGRDRGHQKGHGMAPGGLSRAGCGQPGPGRTGRDARQVARGLGAALRGLQAGLPRARRRDDQPRRGRGSAGRLRCDPQVHPG